MSTGFFFLSFFVLIVKTVKHNYLVFTIESYLDTLTVMVM